MAGIAYRQPAHFTVRRNNRQWRAEAVGVDDRSIRSQQSDRFVNNDTFMESARALNQNGVSVHGPRYCPGNGIGHRHGRGEGHDRRRQKSCQCEFHSCANEDSGLPPNAVSKVNTTELIKRVRSKAISTATAIITVALLHWRPLVSQGRCTNCERQWRTATAIAASGIASASE